MRFYVTLGMLLLGHVLDLTTTTGTNTTEASEQLTTDQSISTTSPKTLTTRANLALLVLSESVETTTAHQSTASSDLAAELTSNSTSVTTSELPTSNVDTSSTSSSESVDISTAHRPDVTGEHTSPRPEISSVTWSELNITAEMDTSSTEPELDDCPVAHNTNSSCMNATEAPQGNMTSRPGNVTTTSSLNDRWSGTILGACYLVTSCLVVLSNTIVMYVIAKTKDLQQPTLWVIAHMAFWDFCQGLSYLIFVIPSAFLNRYVYTESLISATACLFSFLSGITVFNTATVVVDRFMCLKFPLIYRKSSGSKLYGFLACCVFVLAVVRMVLISFPDSDFYYNETFALCLSDYNTLQGAIGSIGFIGIAFGIIVLCSIIIVCMIYRRRRPGVNQSSRDSSSAAKTRLSIMITISAGIFCLSYLPFVIAVIWNLIFGKDAVPGAYLKFVAVALLSNSMFNVVIYTANYTPFRQAMMVTFCKSNLIKQKQKREQLSARSEVHVISTPS